MIKACCIRDASLEEKDKYNVLKDKSSPEKGGQACAPDLEAEARGSCHI